jgi:hypothetical protein
VAKAYHIPNSTYGIFDGIMALAGTLLRSRKHTGLTNYIPWLRRRVVAQPY